MYKLMNIQSITVPSAPLSEELSSIDQLFGLAGVLVYEKAS
jgi:hypothetical protein